MTMTLRLAILSDIHGNLPALEAVLADMGSRDPCGLIIAGDLIVGPQPDETTALLRSVQGWMIRGNSDEGPLRYDDADAPAAWHTHLQFGILRWACAHLASETLDFIRSLPEQRVVHVPGTAPIRVVHGSPRHPAESIYPDSDPALLELALDLTDEPVLVCGHTHEPWWRERDGRLALNPGAVCGPLNGFVGAQYALLTWDGNRWQVEHRAVPYDIGQVRAAFRESGLLAEGGALARAFLRSIETGQDVGKDFLAYARSLAVEDLLQRAEGRYGSYQLVPDPIWEQAAATFPWDCAE
jgi:putative phosphoesterase